MLIYLPKEYELIHQDVVILAAIRGIKPGELIVEVLNREVKNALVKELREAAEIISSNIKKK